MYHLQFLNHVKRLSFLLLIFIGSNVFTQIDNTKRVYKDYTVEVFGSKIGYESTYRFNEVTGEAHSVYSYIHLGPIAYQRIGVFDYIMFFVFSLVFISLVFLIKKNQKAKSLFKRLRRHLALSALLISITCFGYCSFIKYQIIGHWVDEETNEELIFHSSGLVEFRDKDSTFIRPFNIEYFELLDFYIANNKRFYFFTGEKPPYSPASIKFVDKNTIETHWGFCGNSPRIKYTKKLIPNP